MMGGEQFDYGQIEPEVRDRLEELAGVILEGEKRLTCSALVIGAALVEAKQHFAHGIFARWCRVVLKIEPRTAQLRMNAAHLFQRHGDDVCLLPLTAAQYLGAASVDEATVLEVLARVRRGERVTVKWVEQTIRRDKGVSAKMETDEAQSAQIAAMITATLDLRGCRLLHAFLEERPSARQFMADLADRAATKIRTSRGARVTPVMLSLPAP
ncbi:hypothetical protein QY049_26515 [Bradyrhizobium sp. WYCCWR 13022]|uniref:hypothetical protein n=1 Tax=unclassified Bradyrhizobium TaxID=2631580 RepID=UPI00263A9F42|nr:hypothetical protein [Bradyrhizobium sp. WYCCWR 13022]MDN4986718.1 hypothetical protein [Bradyrhizobium sp. WYCCWR 13022]